MLCDKHILCCVGYPFLWEDIHKEPVKVFRGKNTHKVASNCFLRAPFFELTFFLRKFPSQHTPRLGTPGMAGMSTPVGLTPNFASMTPEQIQAYRYDAEINERNAPMTDEVRRSDINGWDGVKMVSNFHRTIQTCYFSFFFETPFFFFLIFPPDWRVASSCASVSSHLPPGVGCHLPSDGLRDCEAAGQLQSHSQVRPVGHAHVGFPQRTENGCGHPTAYTFFMFCWDISRPTPGGTPFFTMQNPDAPKPLLGFQTTGNHHKVNH